MDKKPKIAVLTGAGISAESGLSTFRDSDGLWEKYPVYDVATPSMVKKPRSRSRVLQPTSPESSRGKPQRRSPRFSGARKRLRRDHRHAKRGRPA